MPKGRRDVPPNSILHVVNRGNDKRVIFPQPLDYAAFLVLLREARERFAVELFAYCLMPNHFHLVVRTSNLKALSAYMHFVQREHACDLRCVSRTKGHGHVFQRRYWSQVIDGEGHLLNVMRYVEANPYRAGLIDLSGIWEWSSLWDRETGERDLLHASPLWLPDSWRTIVSVPLHTADMDRIRRPLEKGRPRVYEARKKEAGSRHARCRSIQ